MSYIYFNLNNNKFSIIIFIFASLPIFIKITSLSTTWDSNLSKYSSTTLPRAFLKRALPPIESTTYIHRYRSPFPPVFIPNFLLLAQKKKKKKALQSYPIKKIRRNFHRLDEPPFDTHSHGSSEGARIVRLWRWSSRCFDHGDPPSVAHITKPVVPLSRVYNPLYNTFHRDNPQLLPLGFKSAVSISPTAVSRGAR